MTIRLAREAFAAQLSQGTEWNVSPFPPAVPTAYSVALYPDSPYVTDTNSKASLSCRLRLRVAMFVPAFDNEGNMGALEDMAASIRRLILDATQNCSDLSSPTIASLPSGDLMTAEFTTEILTEW